MEHTKSPSGCIKIRQETGRTILSCLRCKTDRSRRSKCGSLENEFVNTSRLSDSNRRSMSDSAIYHLSRKVIAIQTAKIPGPGSRESARFALNLSHCHPELSEGFGHSKVQCRSGRSLRQGCTCRREHGGVCPGAWLCVDMGCHPKPLKRVLGWRPEFEAVLLHGTGTPTADELACVNNHRPSIFFASPSRLTWLLAVQNGWPVAGFSDTSK